MITGRAALPLSHTRQGAYWPGYGAAAAREKSFAIGFVKSYVSQHPPPEPARASNRGRPRVYPYAKLAAACVLMNFFDLTYQKTENEIPSWDLDFAGRAPDHTYLCRVYQALDEEWLGEALARIAAACLQEAGVESGAMAIDSSGVETDRYETVERLDKKERQESEKREKTYLKWHVVAVLRLQVILSCAATPSNVSDTEMLAPLLGKIGKVGRSFEGWTFNADRGYDSDANFKRVFDAGMHPNIKQRRSVGNSGNRRNKGKPHRRRAERSFDQGKYKRRGMIEGIFGAEETAGHRLRCRYRKECTRRRFGLVRGIAWNIRVLNRIRCRLELGLPIAAAA